MRPSHSEKPLSPALLYRGTISRRIRADVDTMADVTRSGRKQAHYDNPLDANKRPETVNYALFLLTWENAVRFQIRTNMSINTGYTGMRSMKM